MEKTKKAEPLTEEEYEKLDSLLSKRLDWLFQNYPLGFAHSQKVELRFLGRERDELYPKEP